MAEKVIQSTNNNYSEDLMYGNNPDQDLNSIEPEAMLGAVQTNNDMKPQEQAPEPAPQPKKPSKAPIIILLVLLLVGVGIGVFLFIGSQRRARLEAEEEKAKQEELLRLQEEEEERERQEAEELARLQNQKPEEPDTIYSDDEIKELINMGFKMDDIKSFSDKETSFGSIKEQVDLRIKRYYLDEAKKVQSSNDSLYNWTNFGQWPTEVVFDKGRGAKTFKQSAIYEKAPSYGLQTYIKLYLNTEQKQEYILYNIDPLYYNALKETGSITVNYKYRTIDGGAYFVWDIQIEDPLVEDTVDEFAFKNEIER